MTTEQLENLTDRELNERCHELMGLGCLHYWTWTDFETVELCRCGQKYSYQIEITKPNYCQDIKSAFQLVKFAESKGYYFDILGEEKSVQFFNKTPKDSFRDKIEYYSVAFDDVDSIARAITEAFCLAFGKD